MKNIVKLAIKVAAPMLTATFVFGAGSALAGPAVGADMPNAPAPNCLACSTASVQLAQRGPIPRGVPTQVGTAVDLNAVMQDRGNTISMCCPPKFQNGRLGTFDRMAVASGDGASPYGIRFAPDAGLDAAMTSFAPFASQYVPAGFVGNSIHLKAELRHFNPVPWSITTVPQIADFNGPGTALVKQHSMRAWWLPVSGTLAPSGIWSTPLNPGTGWNVPSYQWERSFEVGAPVSISPAHMQPNQWYMVKLSFQIAMKKVGDPNSWEVRDIECNNMVPKYYRIKFDYSPLNKTAPGAPTLVVEEIR